jgi:hypothetical protein
MAVRKRARGHYLIITEEEPKAASSSEQSDPAKPAAPSEKEVNARDVLGGRMRKKRR